MPSIDKLEAVPCKTIPILFVLDASVSKPAWEQQLCKVKEILALYEEKASRSADYQAESIMITYGKQTCFACDKLQEEAELSDLIWSEDFLRSEPNFNSVLTLLADPDAEKIRERFPCGYFPPLVYWFTSCDVPFEKSAPIDRQQLEKLLSSSVYSCSRFWFIALDGACTALHDVPPNENLIRYSQGVFPISTPAEDMVFDCVANEILNPWWESGSIRFPINEITFYFIVETSGGVKRWMLDGLNEAFERLISGLKQFGKDQGLKISIGIIEYNNCCRWLTPGGAMPIQDYCFSPFQSGGLVNCGAAMRELQKMIRQIDIKYPSRCYMPVFTFISYQYPTDDWEKACAELETDWCFLESPHIGVAMSEEGQEFLSEFCHDVRLLSSTPLERFGEDAVMRPMDYILPRYYYITE